jgi:hypothetical protein
MQSAAPCKLLRKGFPPCGSLDCNSQIEFLTNHCISVDLGVAESFASGWVTWIYSSIYAGMCFVGEVDEAEGGMEMRMEEVR